MTPIRSRSIKNRTRLRRRRRLLCETLEQRRLLAVDILLEDFEDAAITYTPSVADDLSDIGNLDYFGRIAPDTAIPTSAGTNGISYANPQGNGYYGFMDADGANSGNVDVVDLDWTGINISGFNNLNLSWYLAEDDSGDGFEDWDIASSFRIAINLDNTGFIDIFRVESELGTDGNATNEKPRVDTLVAGVGDGLGDGTEITNSFSQFSHLIANGSTLDIRVTIEFLDQGDEDIAFDSLLLTGDSVAVPPALVSFQRQSPSPTNADSLVFRATFSEDVQNVDATDFVADGTTAGVTGVTMVSGSVYDITVSGGDLATLDGTVDLDLAGSQNITDLGGAALPPGEPTLDESYLLDNTAPTFTSITRSQARSGQVDRSVRASSGLMPALLKACALTKCRLPGSATSRPWKLWTGQAVKFSPKPWMVTATRAIGPCW